MTSTARGQEFHPSCPTRTTRSSSSRVTRTSGRAAEDLRPYCPKAYLDDYDAFVAYVEDENGSHAVGEVMGTTGHYDVYRRLETSTRTAPPPRSSSTAARTASRFPSSSPTRRSAWPRWAASTTSTTSTPPSAVTCTTSGSPTSARSSPSATSASPTCRCGTSTTRSRKRSGHASTACGASTSRGVRPRPDLEVTLGRPAQVPRPGVGAVLVGVRGPRHGARDPRRRRRPRRPPRWRRELGVRGERAHPPPDPPHDLRGRLRASPGPEGGGHRAARPVVADQEGRPRLAAVDAEPGEEAERVHGDNVFLGASFQSRFEAIDSIEMGYWRNILWGTDYPHVEGTWRFLEDDTVEPYSQRSLRYSYHGLDRTRSRRCSGSTRSRSTASTARRCTTSRRDQRADVRGDRRAPRRDPRRRRPLGLPHRRRVHVVRATTPLLEDSTCPRTATLRTATVRHRRACRHHLV